MQLLLICALIFALGVALFAVQNASPVDISFLFYKFQDISLVIVILFSVLTGAFIVFLLSLVKQISFLRKIHALEKRNEQLEQELRKLAPKDDTLNQGLENNSTETTKTEDSSIENSSMGS
ncbi:MAG: LapA family protein [Dehalobacterium sp.]